MKNEKPTFMDLIIEVNEKLDDIQNKNYPKEALEKQFNEILDELINKMKSAGFNKKNVRRELIQTIEDNYPADSQNDQIAYVGRMLLAESIIHVNDWRNCPLPVLADYSIFCLRSRDILKKQLNGILDELNKKGKK